MGPSSPSDALSSGCVQSCPYSGRVFPEPRLFPLWDIRSSSADESDVRRSFSLLIVIITSGVLSIFLLSFSSLSPSLCECLPNLTLVLEYLPYAKNHA